MDKEFIPYEQALELRELGFDEPCFGWYQDNTLRLDINANQTIKFHEHLGRFKGCFLAPTYSQAFRWFREKHSWQHSIDPTSDQHSFELGYNYWIWNNKTGEEYHTMPKNRPTGDWEYETYEEAELSCLEKLIEVVEQIKSE